ncbi:MAG: metal-dependent hydrolase [Halobacteriales archaeon]|nr:metal-dependent hydrolase [Halobacteriales archaeon]
MIVGHAALAFAVVAYASNRFGLSRERALTLALVAAGFAVVPDVDMAYAVVGTVQSGATGVWSATDAFWGSSQAVHRLATHSLVVAIPAILAFGLVTRDRLGQLTAGVILVGVVILGGLASGPLAAATLVLFAIGGVLVATIASRAGLGTRAVLATAGVGLLLHPFGDVFTGTSPLLLYPVDLRVLPPRVALHPDPTVNLLAVFGLELATIWLAVGAASTLEIIDLPSSLDPRGAIGAGYALAVFVLPPPTLDVSYHFVFSILAVGTVGIVPISRPFDRADLATAAITALLAVTLGGFGYAVTYLVA